MKLFNALLLLLIAASTSAQTAQISGQLLDESQTAVSYANVVLYSAADSTITKVETSDENGNFLFQEIPHGNYFVNASYIGYDDISLPSFELNEDKALGTLSFVANSVQLETAVVKAKRAMVEIKPDRTVFNVQGTINSTGDDAISLLRKAPGIVVDNNDNISVLGRSGVLLYVDGKRLPLVGDELSNYLRGLSSEQIDRIDIITSPGAKYEAEGNAGIIDIRLKKNENHGFNGSFGFDYSNGKADRINGNFSGNYRNKKFNTYATLGGGEGARTEELLFMSTQNEFSLVENNKFWTDNNHYNFRVGTDYFINDKQTIGVLFTGSDYRGESDDNNSVKIAPRSMPENIDSILIAENSNSRDQLGNTFNVNYRIEHEENLVNFDLDYGRYRNTAYFIQPNYYYNADTTELLSTARNEIDSPTDIDIYTAKVDVERNALGGKLGIGSKYSKVVTKNTFLFYDGNGDIPIQIDNRSNLFDYDEKVLAGYISYSRSLSEKWNLSTGLRGEQTNSTGDLQTFVPALQEPAVVQDYFNLFPNLGLTFQYKPMHAFSFNYGKRINRPDYNVLNPFANQISQISFMKGNPFLRPEIVDNFQIGYTLKYRYNFTLSYSNTSDQITRLIGPDDIDARANFIQWDNLANQKIYSLSASLPVQLKDWWSSFFNLSTNYKDNQAEYENGAVVDVQAWGYNIYQQHSFTLGKGYSAELSSWYSGPGIWGGVFEYDESYSINLGLQKKFLDDALNVKLSVQDIFLQAGWSGVSEFNGLRSEGAGDWDSRRVSLAMSYNFGNSKVKSRDRKTGLEEESQRVGDN